MADRNNKDQLSEKDFTDAGFSVEKVGKTTILYERPVSRDVVDTSMLFTRSRTIGYTSKDIPGRKDKRR